MELGNEELIRGKAKCVKERPNDRGGEVSRSWGVSHAVGLVVPPFKFIGSLSKPKQLLFGVVFHSATKDIYTSTETAVLKETTPHPTPPHPQSHL